mmetsp:Transcript_11534/g.21826  ORF Transcript_11534/g.21826 Transcript_11534/m.21826 type:complete len:206 (-) Transcript_11534:382-999(-)
MSSKSMLLTSRPFTDFTTHSFCTPAMKAWPSGSPGYLDCSMTSVMRAPLLLGPGLYFRIPKGRFLNSMATVDSIWPASEASKSSPRAMITSGAMNCRVPMNLSATNGPVLAQWPAPKSISFTTGMFASWVLSVQRRTLSDFRSRCKTFRAWRCWMADTTCLKMYLALASGIGPVFSNISPSSPPLASSITIILPSPPSLGKVSMS